MKKKDILNATKHGGFRSLLKRAFESGVRVNIVPEEPSLFRFEYRGDVVFAKKGIIPVKKRMGKFTQDKNITKIILEDCGIKTAKGVVADNFDSAMRNIGKHKLKYPLLLKPLDGSLAQGVTWDINSKSDLKKAILFFKNSKGSHRSKNFLVEEMAIGNEYRILVLDGKVISCVHKIPATLIGNGKSSIEELVVMFNKNRIKGFEIKLDTVAKKTLDKHKFTLKSVLPKNFSLKLRNNLNMSDGGRSVDCTNKMSNFFRGICEKAVKNMGLGYGGIDLITDDISKNKGKYVILEINSNPFYNMHEKPLVEGKGTDVSKMILKSMFPKLK